ncbi:hypothetical protein WJ0W_000642 [Paenibacillus melissococcoides]|uniref:Uncharacterized protein n=1 Tax=Paenibacillus melissococcoides TaxID=2912268 RepID=A0ABM9FW65_9BACL|nr:MULTISPECIES: hypothetical protein [Paenibacillus]MEB9895931.1 hypothetical protein [Bacillus cereus]CAH8243401.1 hypothetical protein WJ0W_000642 [Paenibacillus melissococcoides]CAH8704404.1 hypothetical protein WDD9_000631 [Paenibacillus melissococcoides]CAH8707673.1 hypothetical protein HTL2_001716 [Paenibacillus melissococcoides]GIO80247.1 hypothetical protein J6TS7_38570 [Paenibacillus dendritiformis]
MAGMFVLLHVIGGISIPSIDMNLPIGEGVSPYTLALTAGTMKAFEANPVPATEAAIVPGAMAGRYMWIAWSSSCCHMGLSSLRSMVSISNTSGSYTGKNMDW